MTSFSIVLDQSFNLNNWIVETPIIKDHHFTVSNKDHKTSELHQKYLNTSKNFINHQLQNQNKLVELLNYSKHTFTINPKKKKIKLEVIS